MAFNLVDFRRVTNGFARACHFSLQIKDFKELSVPNENSSEYGSAFLATQHMFVSAASIPSRTIESQRINVQFGQPGIHIANGVNYQPWTVTFYADDKMMIRTLFLKWQQVILNTVSHAYTMPNRYKSQDAQVNILNSHDNHHVVQTYSFKGLWPTEVGSISLQQQDAGIITFDVTFQYDYFTVNVTENAALANAVEKQREKENAMRELLNKTDARKFDLVKQNVAEKRAEALATPPKTVAEVAPPVVGQPLPNPSVGGDTVAPILT
jgi:hypothetical protein